MDYNKIIILQNTIENMVIDFIKSSELSYYDSIIALDSASNTLRKMLLTKIAYETSLKMDKENPLAEEPDESKNNNE